MLTNANEYRFTDVTGVAIDGGILPAVDGTGAERVMRMENIAYLVEMARERAWWARPVGYDPAAPGADVARVASYVADYTPDLRVPEKTVIRRVAFAAEHWFGIPGTGYGVIPADHAMPPSGVSFPLITVHTEFPYVYGGVRYNYAVDALCAMLGNTVRASSESGVKGYPASDDLRRAYYDFSNMRRFLLSDSTVLGNEARRWPQILANVTAGSPAIWTAYQTLGPMAEGDGRSLYWDGSANQRMDGGYPSFFWRTWAFDGTVSSTMYTTASSPAMCVLVTKGYYATNPKTGNATLAPSLQGYAVFGVTASWYDGSPNAYGGPAGDVQLVTPVTLTDAGSAAGTVFADIGERFYAARNLDGMLPGLFQLAKNFLAARYPGFADKPSHLDLTLHRIIVDTGEITLDSNLPAAWTWTP